MQIFGMQITANIHIHVCVCLCVLEILYADSRICKFCSMVWHVVDLLEIFTVTMSYTLIKTFVFRN